jgi:outer membrane protein assembly factor BamB
LLSLILLIFIPQKTKAEDWPQWRGPHLDGSSQSKNLPASLDPHDSLIWKTTLPGTGSATPAILGDRIFLTAHDHQTNKLLALALNRADGKIIWQQEAALNNENNRMNDLASPSPIAMEDQAIFYFGTGDLVALDDQGNRKWAHSITREHGPFNMLWLYSASPLLFHDKLYIPVLHRDHSVRDHGGGSMADSYLLCLDPHTGKELWRVVRPTDALEESREAYTTPIAIPVGDKSQIVLMGGDHLTGHDADTGKEIWRSPTYNPSKISTWRTVASATFGDGLVFASAPKDGHLFAVAPVQHTDTAIPFAWENHDERTDVCAPLFYNHRLFVLNGDRKTLDCLDPKTGKEIWSTKLGGRAVYRASPTGADDKIYVMNENADVAVLDANKGDILSHFALGTTAQCRASIAVTDNTVYVRTADSLYAFGKK